MLLAMPATVSLTFASPPWHDGKIMGNGNRDNGVQGIVDFLRSPMQRSLHRTLWACALAMAWFTPGLARAQASTVALAHDWLVLLGPFPQQESPEAGSDLAVLLWLQRTRTAEDVARAERGVLISLDSFADVLGRPVDVSRFPLTTALLEKASLDLRTVLDPLKRHFQRPRPYHSHPILVPVVVKEVSHSYPSGHATRGALYGAILAELIPQQRALILERGYRLGHDRALAGVHWPSDIYAGQQLGTTFGKAWLALADHQERLRAALAAEWGTVQTES
jgi:acid phosphatase (class A)